MPAAARPHRTGPGQPPARHLLEHGLVGELRLSVHPVMVGSGQVLFRDGQKQALRLARTRTFGTGVVVLTYHPESEFPVRT